MGKNDHIANIDYIGTYDCEKSEGDIETIESLALVKDLDISDDIEDVNYPYRYQENLPIALNKITNMYEYDRFIYTNMFIDDVRTEEIYNVEGKNIVFLGRVIPSLNFRGVYYELSKWRKNNWY